MICGGDSRCCEGGGYMCAGHAGAGLREYEENEEYTGYEHCSYVMCPCVCRSNIHREP
jgi:hypothetical protein